MYYQAIKKHDISQSIKFSIPREIDKTHSIIYKIKSKILYGLNIHGLKSEDIYPMVDEITSNVQVAPSRQESASVPPARQAQREPDSTGTGQDRVTISKEAQALLAKESRAEVQAESERIAALRAEEADRDAQHRRAESDRLQARREEEPERSAESEENDRTRAYPPPSYK